MFSAPVSRAVGMDAEITIGRWPTDAHVGDDPLALNSQRTDLPQCCDVIKNTLRRRFLDEADMFWSLICFVAHLIFSCFS
jgi:hypothetical protein